MGDPAGASDPRGVRTAEIVASACLATDLGMGFPFEHGLHATLMTTRLAALFGADRHTMRTAYHASLLMYSGCLVESHVTIEIFGGRLEEHVTARQFGSAFEGMTGVLAALPDPRHPLPRKVLASARRLPKAVRRRGPHFAGMCEVATILAERLGVPPDVPALFEFLTERWDGKSALRRARGEEIPLALRLVHVARDAAFQRVIGGDEHAVDTVRRRGAHAFDPDVVDTFVRHAREIFAAADVDGSAWDAALAAEPEPALTLAPEAIDRALAALGDFADLVAPSLSGHSAGVAELGARAAVACGLPPADVRLIRRAGWIHDIGRVAVDPRVWQKRGPLNAEEWEQVRLHAYHGERIAARSAFLASISATASKHHERIDGSGYHRGSSGSSLPAPARVLAAADVYRAAIEPRPYRVACTRKEAASILATEAREGRLDPTAVAALLDVEGQPVERIGRPAGLTEREAEVMGLLARGFATKQVARALGIAVKTADRHVQNAYRKTGVSTRAGATMYAMEHGLVPWGRSPMAGRD